MAASPAAPFNSAAGGLPSRTAQQGSARDIEPSEQEAREPSDSRRQADDQLSAGGAFVGVIAGLLAAVLVPSAVRSLSLTVSPNVLVVLAGIVLAFLVGLLAALYPARRAANMDPATALKYI